METARAARTPWVANMRNAENAENAKNAKKVEKVLESGVAVLTSAVHGAAAVKPRDYKAAKEEFNAAAGVLASVLQTAKGGPSSPDADNSNAPTHQR